MNEEALRLWWVAANSALISAVIVLVGLAYNNLRLRINDNRDKIAEHIKKCDEMPKAVFITKLDFFENLLNELKTDVQEVKEQLIRNEYHEPGNSHIPRRRTRRKVTPRTRKK